MALIACGTERPSGCNLSLRNFFPLIQSCAPWSNSVNERKAGVFRHIWASYKVLDSAVYNLATPRDGGDLGGSYNP
jgi:hypothetical protein